MSKETEIKPERIAGERGATGERAQSNVDKALIYKGAGAAVLIGLVAWGMFGLSGAPKATVVVKAADTAIRTRGTLDLAAEPPAPAAAPALASFVKIDNGPFREDKPDPAIAASQRAPVLAWQRRIAGPSGGAAGGEIPGEPRSGREDAFDGLFKPTVLEGARAGVIQNPDFVIAQGTSIPCVLETAMQSDQPGLVTCVLTHDVLGLTGRVVLLEKGTQVTGQYKGGLKQGQKRLFVLWTRARTPKHVIVTLASPGTDGLGRAGFGGDIDNHWWERFGSALLLSIVSDATSMGAQAIRDQYGVSANNTARAPNQAAAIAVEQGGAIQPTLRKNQGEMVAIMLARDLDFTGIYELRLQRRTVDNDWAREPVK